MFDQKFDRKHIKYAWNCCTSEKLFQHLAEFVGNLGQRMDRIEDLDLDKYADTIKEIQSDISALESSIEMVQTTATGNTEAIVNLLTDLETLTGQVDALAEGTSVEMDDLEQQINDTAETITDIQILISNIQTKLNTMEDDYETLKSSIDTLDTTVSNDIASVNERIDSVVESQDTWNESITSQLEDLVEHFGDIEDLVYGFNSDIVSMKSDITSLEGEVTTVTDKCDALEEEMTSCCDTLTDSLNEVKESVTEVKESVSDVTDSIDKIKDDVTTMQGDVTGCVMNIAQAQQDIEELDDRVTALENEESNEQYFRISETDLVYSSGGVSEVTENGIYFQIKRINNTYTYDIANVVSAQIFPTSVYISDGAGNSETYYIQDELNSHGRIDNNIFANFTLIPLIGDANYVGIIGLFSGNLPSYFSAPFALDITYDLSILVKV